MLAYAYWSIRRGGTETESQNPASSRDSACLGPPVAGFTVHASVCPLVNAPDSLSAPFNSRSQLTGNNGLGQEWTLIKESLQRPGENQASGHDGGYSESY